MRCSGGERQRVALARAFAYDPEILFFDEPLSALDYKLKKTLEKELKDIHKEAGKTFIYITHSLEEAMVMSDRIAVMRDGRIVQIGTPEEIYTRPVNRFVAEFMGEVNVFPVRRRAGRRSTRATSVGGHLPGGGRDRAGGLHRRAAGVPAPARSGRGTPRTSIEARSTTPIRSARASSIGCAPARRCWSSSSRARPAQPPPSTPAWSSAGTARDAIFVES